MQTVAVALGGAASVEQDTAITLDVLDSDIDTTGLCLTITEINYVPVLMRQTILPTGEQVTLNADNTLTVLSDGDIGSGAGAGTINAGTGNDVVFAGTANDNVIAGDVSDTVFGQVGKDTIFEGKVPICSMITVATTAAAAMTRSSAMRAITRFRAGNGDDTHSLENTFGNDIISGGEAGETTGHTLDLGVVTDDLTIYLTALNAEAGSITNGTDTASFTEIETIVLSAGVDTLALANSSGDNTVGGFTGPTVDGAGNWTGVDQLDVRGMTDTSGAQVNTDDVTVTDTNSDGTGDAILTFPGGESSPLPAFPPPPLLISTRWKRLAFLCPTTSSKAPQETI